MKQILSSFGYGIVQDCFGLLNSLKEQGFSRDNFLDFVEGAKKSDLDLVKSQSKGKKPNSKAPEEDIFLKNGEIELMKGVVCEKCKGVVYIEGICSSNPLVQQGFIRRGICGVCGAEFGIR